MCVRQEFIFNCDGAPPSMCLGFFILVASFVLFSVLFCMSACLIGKRKYEVQLEMANWIVSALHSLLATSIGVVVVLNTSRDLIVSRCTLVDFYAWFIVGYFIYDTISLYVIFREKQLDKSFFANSLIIHHVLVLFVAVPIILWLRRGLGDLFVGLLYCMEASVPFVALRGILASSGLKTSRLYLLNGAVMICVFFVVRILVFPFIYLLYAKQRNLELAAAITSLPLHCNAGTIVLFSLQAYWFKNMLTGAIKTWKDVHKISLKTE